MEILDVRAFASAVFWVQGLGVRVELCDASFFTRRCISKIDDTDAWLCNVMVMMYLM